MLTCIPCFRMSTKLSPHVPVQLHFSPSVISKRGTLPPTLCTKFSPTKVQPSSLRAPWTHGSLCTPRRICSGERTLQKFKSAPGSTSTSSPEPTSPQRRFGHARLQSVSDDPTYLTVRNLRIYILMLSWQSSQYIEMIRHGTCRADAPPPIPQRPLDGLVDIRTLG